MKKETRLPRQKTRLAYIPALDGLRGLAALAVLFYHADLRWMPGGFLGVEVFFVLGGYLITTLLLREWDRRGKIDLKAFWRRRVCRLFPATLALIAATLVLTAIWLPDAAASLRGDALAAVGYLSNWRLIWTQRPYFAAMGRPPLLRHLWALAVEAQFYLLWPLLFIMIGRICRPNAKSHSPAKPKRTRYGILIAALAGATISAAWMAVLYRPGTDPSRVYYGTDTRLAGLLIGAALACVWPPDQRRARGRRLYMRLIDGAGLGALCALAAACVYVDEFQPLLYRGGLTMIALLAGTTIALAVHPRARLLPGLLGSAPLRWLGKRSFGLYLWHWPLFMITRPHLDLPFDGAALLLLRLFIAAVLAECSYQMIERPVRYSAAGWGRRLRWTASWGAPLAIVIAVWMTLVPPASAHLSHLEQTPPAARTPTVTPTATSPAATPTPAATSTPQDTPVPARPTPDTPTKAAPTATAPAGPTPTVTATAAPTISPTPTITPVPRVVALGDSVMVGARRELEQTIANIEVDAAVARQAPDMLRLLQERRRSGRLGDIVVIHLGSNGIFGAAQFDAIMNVLTDVPKVIFVNVRVPRRWQDPINKMLSRRTGRCRNVLLADWYAASQDCPACFVDDGVHLNATGAQLYAEFIASCIQTPLQDPLYDPWQ